MGSIDFPVKANDYNVDFTLHLQHGDLKKEHQADQKTLAEKVQVIQVGTNTHWVHQMVNQMSSVLLYKNAL